MTDAAIIRLIDGQPIWYPPSGDAPTPIDTQEAKAKVREFAAASRGGLCFAAPGTDVTLHQVAFSKVEKKHITRTVPFALEEELAVDPEQLHFATQLVDEGHLCAAVCSVEKMDDWGSLVADCGALSRWVPEPMLLPWQPGEWTLVLEGNYAIVRTDRCQGFSIERQLLPGLLQAALGDKEHSPTTVVVYGADQAVEEALLPETLRPAMQWRKGDLRSALLLRRDDDVEINLCQGEYADRLPLGRWWKDWRKVAMLLAGVFCLQLLATYANTLRLEQDNLALRGQIEASYRGVFPRGALVDPEKQLKQQLAQLSGGPSGAGFSSLMSKVGAAVSGQPGAQISTINYTGKSGQMRLTVTAEDFEAVEALRLSMVGKGLEAVMESSNAQGDKVRARLRVEDRS